MTDGDLNVIGKRLLHVQLPIENDRLLIKLQIGMSLITSREITDYEERLDSYQHSLKS